MSSPSPSGRSWYSLDNAWFWLALGLCVVYARGLGLDVMDVDASQYASISMEMLQNGQWLQVQHRQADYLDKPPLLFWSSAFSFLLFGLHNWSYKLPSLLATAAGVYATWRFCLLYYPARTARQAGFILAACIGVLLLGNDVRTDTLLMGMSACTVWQLAAFVHPDTQNKSRHLLAAGFFAGLAMLAKGPIGIIMPAFAVGTHLLLQRNWSGLFQWRWLLALGGTALVLAPMCWGLYQQFDLHPEKIVNGRSGVSGLYFFFWEQSFGRITGENVWQNDTSPFFFLHVYLWAFLPWSILLLPALGQRLQGIFQQKFRLPVSEEAYSLGGFVLTFVALSMSRYKLPHYIFITLPWAAVLTARWLAHWETRLAPTSQSRWNTAQLGLLAVPALLSYLLLGFVFPTDNLFLWGIPTALFGWAFWKTEPASADGLVQRGVLVFLGAALVLNFHFYPNLLPYQSTAAAARYAQAHQIPVDKLAFFNRHGHALDFYSGRILPELADLEQIAATTAGSDAFWLYTDSTGRAQLDSAGLHFEQITRIPHFQVALLKPAFLNPATRMQATEPVFLLKILSQQER
ncbi:MAG: glycosyltransferase family 39 protein [Saprospiraceae bacterium]|nr:glycosyltransferase family 39 protein [Saprospiraceae bacterium]